MESNGKTAVEFSPVGASLVNFWSWAGQKGLINKNTAGGWHKACEEVLGVLDGWESADLRALDPEVPITRFQNLKGGKYTPESMKEYIRRFRLALPSYLSYLDNPAGWKPIVSREKPVRQRQSRPDQTKPLSRQGRPRTEGRGSKGSDSLTEYTFPLREGLLVYFSLPWDFKMAETHRVEAFLRSLAIDFEPPKT